MPIKILIVDDTPSRYKVLYDKLAGLGIKREQIDVAQTANDARDRLDQDTYALLILDVLLPLRAGDEVFEQNSLDLITEIRAGGLRHRPLQLVGITADEKAAGNVHQVFENQLWTLVRYQEDSEEWVGQIANCLEYMLSGDGTAKVAEYGIDVAVICALAEPELEAVRQLDWGWKAARPIDETTFVYDGTVPSADGPLTAIACSAPRMGMISTALLASKVIDKLRPRLLVMAGICAGLPNKTAIGDVLLADPSWDWQSGKRLRDQGNTQFAISPHQLPAPAAVRAHVEQLGSDKEALESIASKWGGPRPKSPKLKIGPVASGSAVLADSEVAEQIKGQHRELCGIEMEAYGLYAAAHMSGRPQPAAFALKSVCDFADESKNDDFQEYAAYTSAAVLDLLLRRYGRKLMPGADLVAGWNIEIGEPGSV